MAENIKNHRPHTSLLGLLVLFTLALFQLKYIHLPKNPIQPNKAGIELVQVVSVPGKVGKGISKQKQNRHNPVITMRRRHKPYFALNWPSHRTSNEGLVPGTKGG